MKKIIVFIMLLFSALTSFTQTKINKENTDVKLEVCKVYQAVLGDEKPLVILNDTRSEEFGRRWVFSRRNPKFAVVQSETLKSYKKNNYWCEINDFVNSEPRKMLITQDEVNSYFENLKTNKAADLPFIEKYKTDHFYTFSKVGFNKNKDQALLTVFWQSISFRGTDSIYIVLSKINGEWKIVRKQGIWSS